MTIKKVYFENTPKFNKNSIYFADWCYKDPVKLNLKNLNYLKNNLNKDYHWNNQKKLKKDQKYLKKITSEMFSYICNRLNEYHEKDYNKEYWKVIVYPWLIMFLDNVFDKWEMIKKIENKKNYLNILYKYNDTDFIPKNYNNLSFADKNLNLWIITKAIEFKKNIKFSKNFKLKKLRNNLYIKRKSYKQKILDVFNLKKKNKKFLFNNIGLSFKDTLKLYVKLRAYPIFWTDVNYTSLDYDMKKRSKIFNHSFKDRNFLSFFKSILRFSIPQSYLEDFNQIKKKLEKKYKRQKIKHIFTATEYKKNDEFKIWTAEQKIYGAQYNCIQHGGTFGVIDFNREVDMIHSVSDKFLTSGWRDKNKKTVPFSSFFLMKKVFQKREKYFDISFIYHHQNSMTYRMSGSVRTNYQRLKIIYNFKSLIDKILNKKKLNICLRYKKNIESQYIKFNERYFSKNIKIDRAENDVNELYANSKLIITDTMSTTFFECMSHNIPVIIFIDKDYEIITERFKKIFLGMKKNNMVFHDLKKINSFIIQNQGKIDPWWNSSNVQKIRLNFIKNFANRSSLSSKLIEKII